MPYKATQVAILALGFRIKFNDVTLLHVITRLKIAGSQWLSGYYPNIQHPGTCLTFHCEFQVKCVQCSQE